MLVTRPPHQATALVQRIEGAGMRAVLWPALEICPVRDPDALARLTRCIAQADLAIFISPNAVEQAVAALPDGAWPASLRIAAVGETTARAVETLLQRPALRPATRHDSEGLLALPALQQVADQRVVIIRGAGGRELLADTLRARGARVEYAEVYQRRCPSQVPEAARAALAAGDVQIITATSGEGLHNLLQSAGPLADLLRRLPLIVVSDRMARAARESGFESDVRVARGAGDEALMEALLAWAGGDE